MTTTYILSEDGVIHEGLDATDVASRVLTFDNRGYELRNEDGTFFLYWQEGGPNSRMGLTEIDVRAADEDEAWSLVAQEVVDEFREMAPDRWLLYTPEEWAEAEAERALPVAPATLSGSSGGAVAEHHEIDDWINANSPKLAAELRAATGARARRKIRDKGRKARANSQ